jgi:hypothetical protein
MHQFPRLLALAATLLLAVVVLTGRYLPEVWAQAGTANKDILDLAKDLQEGKDGATKVADIRKKYELEEVMHGFKHSTKGGIGYEGGPRGATDGIEMKVINLSKKELSAAELAREKQALVKLAYINAAIADVATKFAPTAPKGGKGAKEWNAYAADMKKSALDLSAAAKGSDASRLKKAAANLTNACNGCHGDFRD